MFNVDEPNPPISNWFCVEFAFDVEGLPIIISNLKNKGLVGLGGGGEFTQ